MVLLLSSSSRGVRLSKVLLLCLLFYGVRVFPVRKTRHNLTLYASICAQSLKKIMGHVFRLRQGLRNNRLASPDRLGFSTLPQDFASPDEYSPAQEQILPLPAPLPRLTTTSTTQLEQQPDRSNVVHPGLVTSPTSFRAPEPFHGIRPVTAAQLTPRRWSTSRIDLANLPNVYTHPMMTSENATRGYIPPYTFSFVPDRIRPGWTRFLHPQGSVYYFNWEKKVMTNTNIFDDKSFEVLQNVADQLYRQIEQERVQIPLDTQLVLDIRWDHMAIGYYFATLEGRCLFWAQEKIVKRLFKGIEGVWSHSHMSHLMEAEFWLVAALWTTYSILSQQVVREMKGFLLFTAADQTFNAKTASVYSTEEVDKGLGIVNSIPLDLIRSTASINAREIQHEDGYYMWITGVIMANNALHRFDNYHGQPNARWDRDDVLFDDPGQRSRTPLISFLSPILFYTPETYYRSLTHVLKGESVFFEAWRKFVKELHREWNDLTIIATVLLATNVAFLAIPSLDNGNEPIKRSPAQICSYLSTIWSMSSIVLGQLFSRYHRIKGWEHFDERITDNFNFLSDIGCSQLAIMYSLPYALLSWSLVAFLVAFLVMCFDGTHNVVRLITGVTSAIVTLVIIYCVWRMRASDEERDQNSFPMDVWNVFREVAAGYCI